MNHLNQMNIGSELFLKEKKKQDIVKDLKMAFGDNIVSTTLFFHVVMTSVICASCEKDFKVVHRLQQDSWYHWRFIFT